MSGGPDRDGPSILHRSASDTEADAPPRTEQSASLTSYGALKGRRDSQDLPVRRPSRARSSHPSRSHSRYQHLDLEAHRAHHSETHAGSPQFVQDAILGAADGLTVPFALAAGLSGAFTRSRYIVLAVASELVAGSISMGLGGWLAGRSEVQTFDAERERERYEVETVPLAEEAEIYDIFRPYGVPDRAIESVVAHFRQNRNDWVDFMMKFELGLNEPDRNRPWKSALTVGGAYALGGLVPLTPYLFIPAAVEAFRWSVVVSFMALLAFGWLKAAATGERRLRSAAETALTGACAAAAAYAMAKWFNSLSPEV
ncbi:hypothetical protein CDCA_CDCA02G0683 [Cyanidium caldarium]|uniref:Uncharacterized protein n=1 Tax=Cyanidium caldarium TaxID=2771 RepID=A0AAV9IQX6_CYACA|nr:hypothetical protein CDCA_CDCA02G0683 [Cyanidium caldarium]